MTGLISNQSIILVVIIQQFSTIKKEIPKNSLFILKSIRIQNNESHRIGGHFYIQFTVTGFYRNFSVKMMCISNVSKRITQ